MKFTLRNIPANSQKLASTRSSAVAYLFVNMHAQLCAVGFSGKSVKHSFRLSFKTTAARLQYVSAWLQKKDGLAAETASIKAEKRAEESKPHTMKVGDVLCSSWGYDQTNVDYYQVTALIGARMVEIREISQQRQTTLAMQGDCVPTKNAFVGEPLRKMVKEDQFGARVRIASYASAYRIDPVKIGGIECFEAASWSSYA